MPFLLEHITEVVVAIIILVLLANGALVAMAFTRRQRRERYFQRIDALRQQYGPLVAATLSGQLEYSKGLLALQGITGLDREFILEQLCLEKPVVGPQVSTLRQLCEDLGLVKLWQRHLEGKFDVSTLRVALARPEGLIHRVGRLSFLRQAKCAENLGTVRHQPSWSLLLKALHGTHRDVQAAALRALAAIGEPESFPALVECLHEVVLRPQLPLSLRSVKTALISFHLIQALGLLESLNHPHPRIRFLATDIIREMVERQAGSDEDFELAPPLFSAELSEVFLTHLCFDENADVRARAAPVIAYLVDPRATPVLLTLLEDPLWFVRLHTVRALEARKFQPQAPQIALRLSDENWMVREAAAKALLTFGQLGLNHLYDHFLETQDRYCREQITDAMQRGGLVPDVLAEYGNAANGREVLVLEQLIRMGKTGYMVAVLSRSPNQLLRKKFLERFGRSTDPQIQTWVLDLATRGTDEELKALARKAVGPSPRQGAV
jgi:HEAT repeat protein